MVKRKAGALLHFIIVGIFGILMLLPFYYVIINTFKSYGEVMTSFSSLPTRISLKIMWAL